ncbi:Uncharacterised protein [Serratia marcescens]|uniref:hypothetical protein n=1 Tax=Serratia marcescens TaxID=615 RepID=UPI000745272D|nr:hypothetical protein [Serratia marcescens]CUY64175.1 Uncharacterised protein [Serratia marcescens]CUZ30160.1 Uncharacterised protein [Serratia marcescens]CUZ42648.1 Uncharacterised protein [Serratia marcescens]CVG81133.1 Uncharacterised protein [Serratia marcescens]
MSTEKLSELSRPVRIHRDWNRASMCHCGKCGRWKMTIADADGVQTCASCYDAEWLSEWQNYAEAADKRIAELEGSATLLTNQRDLWYGKVQDLEAKLATPVRLPNKNDAEFWFGSTFQVAKFDRAVERAIRAAGFTVEGDE